MLEKYYYWLHNVPGIGRITMQKILVQMTPEELYKSKLEKTNSIFTKKQMDAIAESKNRWDIEKEWEKLEKRKIKLLCLGEENYPEKLSKISDPPIILYQKGKDNLLEKPSVAVIGARACSHYGSLAAKELGRELVHMGIVVVSGMARGIDGICQWAALEHGGESVGVLGCGVEVCYPPENRSLYDRLQQEGTLVSENPPFMQPSAGLFPLRNRIISGLADMVVVVESREKSGTLITVDMALEQGKEVYAIPGRMTDSVSRGCNKLIKQGAGVILSPREFVEEICPILLQKYQNIVEDKNIKEKKSWQERSLRHEGEKGERRQEEKADKYIGLKVAASEEEKKESLEAKNVDKSIGLKAVTEEEKKEILQEKNVDKSIGLKAVTEEEKSILRALDVSLKNIEEIYVEVRKEIKGITLNKIMEILLQLQLNNIVKEENGYYGVSGNYLWRR